MYQEFYGLSERPFTLMPDPDFLYLSPQHRLARAYLEYGLTQQLDFIVLTGDVGTGKTTLIKSLLRDANRKQRIGVIYQTSFGAEDLLELLLREFCIKGHFTTRVARLAAFNQLLLNAHSRGEQVVLIVDEAQNLGPEALEELRLLSNLQTDKEPLLQIILVGQPDLQEHLRHSSLMQLSQRVSVQYHLTPLDKKETREYVVYRLARVGGSGIFTDSALEKLYEYTKGVPRYLNTFCDLALVAGFAEGRRDIDAEFLDTVMAAHGFGMETLEPSAGLGPEPQANYQEPADSRPLGLDDGLGLAVAEMSSRLSRLECLALELIGHLLPVLRKLLGKPAPPDIEKALTAEPPDISLLEKAAPTPQDLTKEIPPPVSQVSGQALDRAWQESQVTEDLIGGEESANATAYKPLRPPPPSSSLTRFGALAAAILMLGVVGYMIYNNYATVPLKPSPPVTDRAASSAETFPSPRQEPSRVAPGIVTQVPPQDQAEVKTAAQPEPAPDNTGQAIPDVAKHVAGQPSVLKPQAEPLPQPQVEPKIATGLNEVTPSSSPLPPSSRALPVTTPQPQATSQESLSGRWPWSSERIIRPEDLSQLTLAELELMRNEIYARHGWVFNRKDLQQHFQSQSWYRPKADKSNQEQANRLAQAEMSSIEKKNVQIIAGREKAMKR